MFRVLLQKLAQYSIKPVVERFYLNKERKVRVLGLILNVGPSVFHPSLYFSSKFMGRFIQTLDLENKTVIDVGTGSGILAITAAKKGAKVTAIDINPKAVEIARLNSELNNLKIEVLESDLFSEVQAKFDVVVVNPPYFMNKVKSVGEYAWNAGENAEYFYRFFNELPSVLKAKSDVFMVLASNCDINRIIDIATQNGFSVNLIIQKEYWLEKNFVYKIEPLKPFDHAFFN